MCGIIGTITRNGGDKQVAKRVFKTLVIDNESRGGDSTGVLSIQREEKTFSLFKGTMGADVFMNRKKFNKTEGDIWIGHTRFATTGDVTERNAHPLNRNNMFLAHNGMISNHKEIAKRFSIEYEVDSEVLIPYIENEDWEGLPQVHGSYNFIAWNKEKERIYVHKHNNPLYALDLSEFGVLAFSSLKGGLDILAEHYSRKDRPYELAEDKVFELDMFGSIVNSIDIEQEELKALPYKFGNENKSYPRYYGAEDYYDMDDDYTGFYDNMCDICYSDITSDEKTESEHGYGASLCPRCVTKLEAYFDRLSKGEDIGEFDSEFEKYEKILLANGLLEYANI